MYLVYILNWIHQLSNESKISIVSYKYNRRWYLGDIVVSDIGQPQCHKCTKKNLCKRKKKGICDIVVGQCHQPQCHPSSTPRSYFYPLPPTQKNILKGKIVQEGDGGLGQNRRI